MQASLDSLESGLTCRKVLYLKNEESEETAFIKNPLVLSKFLAYFAQKQFKVKRALFRSH